MINFLKDVLNFLLAVGALTIIISSVLFGGIFLLVLGVSFVFWEVPNIPISLVWFVGRVCVILGVVSSISITAPSFGEIKWIK